MNEGACVLHNGSYRCECQGGWEGPHCENRECDISSHIGAGGWVVSVLLFPTTVAKGGSRALTEGVSHLFIHE